MKKLLVALLLVPTIASAHPKLEESLGGQPIRKLTKTVHGLITAKQSDGTFHCSGTLISPQHVLTAGHCVAARDGDEAIVPSQFSIRIANGTYSVTELAVNPGYNPNDEVGNASSKFDIGILTLDRAVTEVQPLGFGTPASTGETLYFYGYGTNAEGTRRPAKRAARGKVLVSNVVDGIFEAQRSPKKKYATSCPGDSGGAVVRGLGSDAVIVGSVSAGSTGQSNSGACKSTANPDDDIFVDVLSESSQAFIQSVIQ